MQFKCKNYSYIFFPALKYKEDIFLWILRIFYLIPKTLAGTLCLSKFCAWLGPSLTQYNMPRIRMLFLAVTECSWHHLQSLQTWAKNQRITPGTRVLSTEDENRAC